MAAPQRRTRGKELAGSKKVSTPKTSKTVTTPKNGLDKIDMALLAREATRSMSSNKARIEAGETFRAGARTGKQRSPGSNRDGLHS